MGIIFCRFEFWKSSLHAPQGANFLSPRGQICYNIFIHESNSFSFAQDHLGLISDTFWIWVWKKLVPARWMVGLGCLWVSPRGKMWFFMFICWFSWYFSFMNMRVMSYTFELEMNGSCSPGVPGRGGPRGPMCYNFCWLNDFFSGSSDIWLDSYLTHHFEF